MVQTDEFIIYADKIKLHINIYGHACSSCGLSVVSISKDYLGANGKIYYNDLLSFIETNTTQYLKQCHDITFEKVYKLNDENEYIAEIYLSDAC